MYNDITLCSCVDKVMMCVAQVHFLASLTIHAAHGTSSDTAAAATATVVTVTSAMLCTYLMVTDGSQSVSS
jgi:hypothetical protein